MKKSLALVLLGLLLGAGSAWSYQRVVKRSRFVDEVYGYSIDAPRFPGSGPTTASIAAYFAGPSGEGFASSVNVMVQPARTTLAEHRAKMLAEFRLLDLKVNSDRDLVVSGRDAVEFDYQGKPTGDKELHFLILAVVDKDRVIQVTCTASPEKFAAAEAEFRASLASFRLDGPAP